MLLVIKQTNKPKKNSAKVIFERNHVNSPNGTFVMNGKTSYKWARRPWGWTTISNPDRLENYEGCDTALVNAHRSRAPKGAAIGSNALPHPSRVLAPPPRPSPQRCVEAALVDANQTRSPKGAAAATGSDVPLHPLRISPPPPPQRRNPAAPRLEMERKGGEG